MKNNIHKVHCLFEQSGTFKNEFIKLGIAAEDYDIQDNFGQTDNVIDLFHEIEICYGGGQSIFDNFRKDDLVMAFFPCIYFCAMSQIAMSISSYNYRTFTVKQATDAILQRSANREQFFRLAVMLYSICLDRGLRMIMENPWAEQTFLKANFVAPPTLIDNDRTKRGDYFVKPTAYWFVNMTPTHGQTITPCPSRQKKTIQKSKQAAHAGLCSEERSMISPQYAHNFICDYILGKPTKGTQLQLDL